MVSLFSLKINEHKQYHTVNTAAPAEAAIDAVAAMP